MKKDLNFELNIIPMIDILSVCICFLLMTIVWVQVGAIKSAQAIGGQPKTEAQRPASIWATMTPQGNVVIDVKDVPKARKYSQEVTLAQVPRVIESLKARLPDLHTGLIMPARQTAYSEIVSVMDQMKRVGIRDIGISPL